VAYNATFKSLYKQLALNCSTALMRLTCVELYLPCVVIPIPLGPPPIPGTHTQQDVALALGVYVALNKPAYFLSLSLFLSVRLPACYESKSLPLCMIIHYNGNNDTAYNLSIPFAPCPGLCHDVYQYCGATLALEAGCSNTTFAPPSPPPAPAPAPPSANSTGAPAAPAAPSGIPPGIPPAFLPILEQIEMLPCATVPFNNTLCALIVVDRRRWANTFSLIPTTTCLFVFFCFVQSLEHVRR